MVHAAGQSPACAARARSSTSGLRAPSSANHAGDGARDLVAWHVDRASVQAIADSVDRPGPRGASIHARYSEATGRRMSHVSKSD